MPVAELGDPRLEAMFAPSNLGPATARPTVAVSRRGAPGWVFAAAAAFAALMLFWALESRRTTRVVEAEPDAQTIPLAAPPPLYIPPAPVVQQQPGTPVQVINQAAPLPTPISVPVQNVQEPPRYQRPIMIPSNPVMPMPPPGRATRGGGGPTMVIDAPPASAASAQQGDGAAPGLGGAFGTSLGGGRARASSLANPAQTVPQGALIPAVLETAFNSTQAGFARAIVARDVRSFDGSKVLIPRGSRLIGQYRADVGAGQSRAVINWTRLIRGDGVTIALNSPAVDPLGRGGVKARVNNHLFERVTDGLLQSVFSVAGNLALSRSSTNVILAPGGMQTPTATTGDRPMRTLSVPAGTSISVFVAQDLEFPNREAGE
ncbi:MAG: TrbI/VirB10 family protein [Sphingomicrobium sp.]